MRFVSGLRTSVPSNLKLLRFNCDDVRQWDLQAALSRPQLVERPYQKSCLRSTRQSRAHVYTHRSGWVHVRRHL